MSTLIIPKNIPIPLITIWFPFGVAAKKATDFGRTTAKDIHNPPGNGFKDTVKVRSSSTHATIAAKRRLLTFKKTLYFSQPLAALILGTSVNTTRANKADTVATEGLPDIMPEYIEDFSEKARSIGLLYHENKKVFIR